MTTAETIRERIREAEAREKAAEMEKHRAMAELAAIEGNEKKRAYHEAYVAAQTNQPGGHERFWDICRRQDAESVIAGTAKLDDFVSWERKSIAEEVARLLAEREAKENAIDDLLRDRPSHETHPPDAA